MTVTTTAALRLRGISKRYGPVQALTDVSMEIRAGEVVGLLGDNGAGKSTLVKIISGAERPDDGELVIDGAARRFASPNDAHAAGIETVFQTLSLIPTLDIAENVYLRRELCGPGPVSRFLHRMDKRRMRREVSAGFERLGLSLPSPRTRVAGLSGGQRQAVAIARAVLWGSHIVVMDEPSAALGVRQAEIVLGFIERLKEHGIAVLLISHNADHVLRVCDRVVVLRLGRKIADRSVEGLPPRDLVTLMSGVELPPAVAP
jgi:ABC-type sugar transport system ATPase subunit